MKSVTLKEQTNVLKYRTDTLFNGKHARRFSGHPGPSPCPLCGAPDSTSHTLLRCTHPQINRMNINRHHQALSICGEAISKGDFGSYIVSIDACNTERLLPGHGNSKWCPLILRHSTLAVSIQKTIRFTALSP